MIFIDDVYKLFNDFKGVNKDKDGKLVINSISTDNDKKADAIIPIDDYNGLMEFVKSHELEVVTLIKDLGNDFD